MESESGSSASAPLAQTHKKRKRDGGSGEEGKRKSKGKKADHGEGRVEDKPKKKRKRKVASSDVEPEEDRIVVPPLHPNPYMEGWRRERAAQEAVQRNYVKREDEERSESTVDVEPDEVDHGEDGKVFTVDGITKAQYIAVDGDRYPRWRYTIKWHGYTLKATDADHEAPIPVGLFGEEHEMVTLFWQELGIDVNKRKKKKSKKRSRGEGNEFSDEDTNIADEPKGYEGEEHITPPRLLEYWHRLANADYTKEIKESKRELKRLIDLGLQVKEKDKIRNLKLEIQMAKYQRRVSEELRMAECVALAAIGQQPMVVDGLASRGGSLEPDSYKPSAKLPVSALPKLPAPTESFDAGPSSRPAISNLQSKSTTNVSSASLPPKSKVATAELPPQVKKKKAIPPRRVQDSPEPLFAPADEDEEPTQKEEEIPRKISRQAHKPIWEREQERSSVSSSSGAVAATQEPASNGLLDDSAPISATTPTLGLLRPTTSMLPPPPPERRPIPKKTIADDTIDTTSVSAAASSSSASAKEAVDAASQLAVQSPTLPPPPPPRPLPDISSSVGPPPRALVRPILPPPTASAASSSVARPGDPRARPRPPAAPAPAPASEVPMTPTAVRSEPPSGIDTYASLDNCSKGLALESSLIRGQVPIGRLIVAAATPAQGSWTGVESSTVLTVGNMMPIEVIRLTLTGRPILQRCIIKAAETQSQAFVQQILRDMGSAGSEKMVCMGAFQGLSPDFSLILCSTGSDIAGVPPAEYSSGDALVGIVVSLQLEGNRLEQPSIFTSSGRDLHLSPTSRLAPELEIFGFSDEFFVKAKGQKVVLHVETEKQKLSKALKDGGSRLLDVYASSEQPDMIITDNANVHHVIKSKSLRAMIDAGTRVWTFGPAEHLAVDGWRLRRICEVRGVTVTFSPMFILKDPELMLRIAKRINALPGHRLILLAQIIPVLDRSFSDPGRCPSPIKARAAFIEALEYFEIVLPVPDRPSPMLTARKRALAQDWASSTLWSAKVAVAARQPPAPLPDNMTRLLAGSRLDDAKWKDMLDAELSQLLDLSRRHLRTTELRFSKTIYVGADRLMSDGLTPRFANLAPDLELVQRMRGEEFLQTITVK